MGLGHLVCLVCWLLLVRCHIWVVFFFRDVDKSGCTPPHFQTKWKIVAKHSHGFCLCYSLTTLSNPEAKAILSWPMRSTAIIFHELLGAPMGQTVPRTTRTARDTPLFPENRVGIAIIYYSYPSSFCLFPRHPFFRNIPFFFRPRSPLLRGGVGWRRLAMTP